MASGARWELHDARAESIETWRRRMVQEDLGRRLEASRRAFQALPPWAQILVTVMVSLRSR